MTTPTPDVKDTAGGIRRKLSALRDWIDTHPRTGWYITIVVTLDFLLQVAQTLH